MKRRSLTTFCLTLILTAQTWAQTEFSGQISSPMPAAPKKESKLLADWRLRLNGTDFHDDQSQAKFVAIYLDLRSKYLLTSSLHIDFQPSFRLVSGQSQTIDGADKMENKILLTQAAAHYTPLSNLRLSAGALNQRYMHTSLLVDEMAFPAARAIGGFKADAFESSLAFETAIPTSTSLSTNTKELEPTPSLNTLALISKWGDKEAYWKASIGYFAYNNLPSAVAQQSLLLGNSVQNISDAQYNFVNKYQGTEASSEVQLPVHSRFDLYGRIEYLHNDKASSQDATASMYAAGVNLHLNAGLDCSLIGSYFSVAPEAAVAYFNAHNYETNRIGYGAESALSFKKEGFRLRVQYKDSEVMYQNPVQSREKLLMLKLETFYANI